MRRNEFKRKPLTEWVAYSLATATLVGSTLVYAASPAAGTEIKNLATVTYEDEQGNTYSAQSNEAIITVAPQYKAFIEADNDVTAAPGQTVYFPHTVTNTGNETDTYTLAIDAAAVTAGAKIYLDTNGNGQPDAGEIEVTEVMLNAGEVGNVVIAYPVDAGAAANDTATVTLTVDSQATPGVGAVKDAGGADNELTDTFTVTGDAVIVSTKSSTIDKTNNQITYTLTVKNVGGAAENNVVILDALPTVDTDGDGDSDYQVTMVGAPVLSGFLEAGDTLAAAAVTDETALGFDVDGDGSQGLEAAADNSLKVLRVVDVSLPPNTTVSVQFTVQYDPTLEAGTGVENTFVAYPTPDPANPVDPTTLVTPPNPSNKTTDDIPVTHGIKVDDTGVADPDSDATTMNDGGDDDGAVNGTQSVDSASSGQVVEYLIDITNEGNGDDIFNLTAVNNNFPAGTVITFWSPDGTVQLTDSDSDGIPDTGVIPGSTAGMTPGDNVQQVMVKVDLPSGSELASTDPAMTATVTTTSSGDPAQTDDVTLEVKEIIAPKVDLAGQAATAGDGYLPTPADAVDAHPMTAVVETFALTPGVEQVIPVKVANESGSSEAYLLSSLNVPEAWNVVFKHKDTGNPTIPQQVITSTPFIPGGDDYEFFAVVTVPADATKALADAPNAGANTDPALGNMDSNADTDSDYVIRFKATSASNAAIENEIGYSFDIDATAESVVVTPAGQNQIAPGGTVDYKHNVQNTGNTIQPVEFEIDNNTDGFNSVIMIDTDADGVPDTNYADLSAGDTIDVLNPDGSTSTLTLTDTDATPDGNVEIPLEPGQYLGVVNKTSAPTDAAPGVVNTSTVKVTQPDGTLLSSIEDNSSVILGQVRLNKTVALDADCNGTADDPASFAEIQSTQVEPGQCATWKLVAKNEGNATVKNVVITDNVPEFTTYLATSLQYCQGIGCAPAAIPTAPPADINAAIVGDTITANVGTGATATEGGELVAGDEATVMFTIQID